MRAVVQRVKSASVVSDGELTGAITVGLVVFVGFNEIDGFKDYEYISEKICGLRIFEDDFGKMNFSVKDIEGGILLIPNFTLYGDARKGRRPDFTSSSPVSKAKSQFEEFARILKIAHPMLQSGVFQTNMQINQINDGPVTILLESCKNF